MMIRVMYLNTFKKIMENPWEGKGQIKGKHCVLTWTSGRLEPAGRQSQEQLNSHYAEKRLNPRLRTVFIYTTVNKIQTDTPGRI